VKMWTGRFSQELNAEFEDWQRSFPFDRILVPYEVAASQAHAAALAKAGVLTSAELSLTQKALGKIADEGVPADKDPSIEDVHHYVEKRLVEIVGEAGKKLHTGRSRNEQIATDLRLYVRAQIDEISLLLAELAGEFVTQAEKAGNAAMPSYTHLQRAEPVLVAHWLLAYVAMLERDLSRLADCRARMNLCPLGSAAVAGTILPLDRAGVAQALEFDAPTANSIDATSDRDFAIEFVQALSQVAMHLSRWAEESILFASTEFGFIKLPEAFSTGSSAMPQKKNPDALELIRGKAAKIFAEATGLFLTMKGLPLAYNKDMQETQQPVFAAAQQVSSVARVATGLVATVTFDYERMQEAASTGYMNAMAGAAHLVKQGVPFRTAHERIGKAVQLCVAKKCELEQLAVDDFASCSINADPAFYEALQLEHVLAIHDVPGGTAPSHVRAALQAAKETLLKYSGAAHVGA
jgi:argininosuccinate lyase